MDEEEKRRFLEFIFKPDTDSPAIEDDERAKLAILRDETTDVAARVAVLDEFAQILKEGQELILFEEIMETAIGLLEKCETSNDAEWDALTIGLINFAATAFGKEPDFPRNMHRKIVDEIIRSQGPVVKTPRSREPS